MQLNYLDIILLLPIVYGLIRGLMRGFVIELTSILAVLAGIIAAKLFAPVFAVKILSVLDAPDWLGQSLAYVLLFTGVTLGCKLLGKVIQRLLRAIQLGWLDKLLGALFGALKWVLILSVILNILLIPEQYVHLIKEEAKQTSLLYQPTLTVAATSWDKMKQYLPEIPPIDREGK